MGSIRLAQDLGVEGETTDERVGEGFKEGSRIRGVEWEAYVCQGPGVPFSEGRRKDRFPHLILL